MRSRATPPEVRWTVVILGGLVAFAVAGLAFVAFGRGSALAATSTGLAAGALAAGRLAPAAGGLHGGLVAVLWIAAEALAETFLPADADPLAGTATTIVADVLRLAVGVAAGWAGGRLR